MWFLKPLPFILIPLIWVFYAGGLSSCGTDHTNAGIEAYEAGDYEKAEMHLTKVIDSGIENKKLSIAVHYFRGLSRLSLNKAVLCIEDADELVRLDSGHSRGYKLRGMAMALLERHEQVVSDLTMALEKGIAENAVPAVRLIRAGSYFRLGKLDQALEEANQLVMVESMRIQALELRAGIWGDRGEWDKCYTDCTDALASGDVENLSSNGLKIYLLRMAAAVVLNRPATAQADADRVGELSTDPDILSVKSLLMKDVHMKAGNTEQAIAELGKAIETGVRLAEAYSSRCGLWEILGENEKGVADADKAIELGEQSSFIYLNRAVCLQRMGRTAEADRDWDKAINLEPRSDLPYFYRGLAFAHAEDYARALPCWLRGVELHEQYEGEFSKDTKGLERLRSACSATRSALGNSHAVCLVSGWLHLQAKDKAKAKAEFDRALKLAPGNRLAKSLLAKARGNGGLVIENGTRRLRLNVN